MKRRFSRTIDECLLQCFCYFLWLWRGLATDIIMCCILGFMFYVGFYFCVCFAFGCFFRWFATTDNYGRILYSIEEGTQRWRTRRRRKSLSYKSIFLNSIFLYSIFMSYLTVVCSLLLWKIFNTLFVQFSCIFIFMRNSSSRIKSVYNGLMKLLIWYTPLFFYDCLVLLHFMFLFFIYYFSFNICIHFFFFL